MRNKIIALIICMVVLCLSASCIAQEFQPILLPAPSLSTEVSLQQALQRRSSERSFDPDREFPTQVLSNLLWAANGINRPESGKRTAPSARNTQAIDIYVALKSGLYFYDAKDNILRPQVDKDIRADIGIQEFTKDASVGLIFVADFDKMANDEQANVISAATDTGFISQNVYLYCASDGLATVVLGWVDKPRLKEVMGLREKQHVVLTQPVGYLK